MKHDVKIVDRELDHVAPFARTLQDGELEVLFSQGFDTMIKLFPHTFRMNETTNEWSILLMIDLQI